jgi:hypothetical protein
MRILTLLLAASILLSGASCSSSGPHEVGNGTTSGDIYGDAPPLEDYRRMLGELEPLMEEGGVFFGQSRGPSEAQYEAIAAEYRRRGLKALSADDKQKLILVAQIAFLAHVDTLRYLMTAEDAEKDSQDGHYTDAVLEEVYRHRLALSVAARHINGGRVSWSWVSAPVLDSKAPDERLEVFEDLPDDAELITSWDNRSGEWQCSATKISGSDWGMAHVDYYSAFRGFASGQLVGTDVVDGRDAYRFQGAELDYWLDADTLWLRQYEYERDGIRYTVKLEAVNDDITIEPPDVDVPCVEETPSP